MKRIIQPLERCDGVDGHHARLLNRKLLRYGGGVLRFEGRKLRIKAALGIHQINPVDAVSFFQSVYLLPYRFHSARAVGTQYMRKLRFDAELSGESAFTLKRIPRAHARC